MATDDERIVDAVESFGGRAHMTSLDHKSGTDRLAEVAQIEAWADDEIVVNLQGDEPCMDPAAVRLVAELLTREESGDIATLATPLREAADLFFAERGEGDRRRRGHGVLVQPRAVAVGAWASSTPVQSPRCPEHVPFLRHLGIYAYRVAVLRRVCAAAPHAHELAESLEQLRALAMGVRIRVGVVDEAPGHGVDTEADLARARGASQLSCASRNRRSFRSR